MPLALFIFLIGALGPVAQPPAPTPAAKKAHDTAVGYMQRRLYFEAERHFAEAAKLAPGWGAGHYGIAVCHYFTKRYRTALPHLNRALECPDPQADYYANKGTILEVLGEVDEAWPFFEKALELDPKHVNAGFNLGQIALRKGRVDEARKRLEHVRTLDPTHAGARYCMAKVEFRARNYDEAEALATAIPITDKFGYEALYLAAQVAFRTGRRDVGKARLAESRALKKQQLADEALQAKIGGLLDVAFKFLGKRDIRQGVGYLKAVLELDADNPHATNALVQIRDSFAKANRTADADAVQKILDAAAARAKSSGKPSVGH